MAACIHGGGKRVDEGGRINDVDRWVGGRIINGRMDG